MGNNPERKRSKVGYLCRNSETLGGRYHLIFSNTYLKNHTTHLILFGEAGKEFESSTKLCEFFSICLHLFFGAFRIFQTLHPSVRSARLHRLFETTFCFILIKWKKLKEPQEEIKDLTAILQSSSQDGFQVQPENVRSEVAEMQVFSMGTTWASYVGGGLEGVMTPIIKLDQLV